MSDYRSTDLVTPATTGPVKKWDMTKAFFMERMLKSKNPFISLPSMLVYGIVSVISEIWADEMGQMIFVCVCGTFTIMVPVVFATIYSSLWLLAFPVYATIGFTAYGYAKMRELNGPK